MTPFRRWGRIASVLAVLATVAFLAPAPADASTAPAPTAPHATAAGPGRVEPSAALPASPPLRTARASRSAGAAIVPRVGVALPAAPVSLLVPVRSAGPDRPGATAPPSRGPPLRPSH